MTSANQLFSSLFSSTYLRELPCLLVRAPLNLARSNSQFGWIEEAAVAGIGPLSPLPAMTSRFIQPALRSADTFLDGQLENSWQEFLNKIQIYNAVKQVEKSLGLADVSGLTLHDLLRRADQLDEFVRGWSYEGIGYYYTKSKLNDGDVCALLRGAETSPESRTMLHAGMGMAFADWNLHQLRRGTLTPKTMLLQFERQCVANAEDDYVGASLEALGLMCRTYFRDLFATIVETLRTTATTTRVAEFLWHGVGRAVYFDLADFLPCCDLNLEKVARETQGEQEQQNLLAGLAWAATLVNIRHPQIIASAFPYHDLPPLASQAIQNGVTSSLLVAYVSSPRVDFVSPFCEGFQCVCRNSEPASELVRKACRVANNLNRQGIQTSLQVGELFRFQVPEWFENKSHG